MALTVRPAVLPMFPSFAEMVTVPPFIPVTTPLLLTVAIAELDELQVTFEVTFFELPSLYLPVAVSCSDFPTASDEDDELTVMLTNAGCGDDGGGGVLKLELLPLPQPISEDTNNTARVHSAIFKRMPKFSRFLVGRENPCPLRELIHLRAG